MAEVAIENFYLKCQDNKETTAWNSIIKTCFHKKWQLFFQIREQGDKLFGLIPKPGTEN